jgi:hypothetical protein
MFSVMMATWYSLKSNKQQTIPVVNISLTLKDHPKVDLFMLLDNAINFYYLSKANLS